MQVEKVRTTCKASYLSSEPSRKSSISLFMNLKDLFRKQIQVCLTHNNPSMFQVYDLINSDVHILMKSPRQSTFPTPLKVSCLFVSTDLLSQYVRLHFLFDIKGITQYRWIRIDSLLDSFHKYNHSDIRPSCFLNISIDHSFKLLSSIIWTYHIFLIHSPIDRYLDFYQHFQGISIRGPVNKLQR